MFITNVLMKRVKSKKLMVLMESVVSGHQFNIIRERLADKIEIIRFDPYKNAEKFVAIKVSAAVDVHGLGSYMNCRE